MTTPTHADNVLKAAHRKEAARQYLTAHIFRDNEIYTVIRHTTTARNQYVDLYAIIQGSLERITHHVAEYCDFSYSYKHEAIRVMDEGCGRLHTAATPTRYLATALFGRTGLLTAAIL